MRRCAGLALPIAAGVVAATIAAAVALRSAPAPVSFAATSPSDGRLRYPPGRYPVLTLPDGSHREVRSLLDLGRPLSFGDYRWQDHGVPPGPVWVRVDLDHQTLSVFRAGHEIGTAVILYGADAKPTRPGVFPVLARLEHHQSSLYDAEMPYTLRLTDDGIAIHASAVRPSAATHGCIGVPLAFAARLFAAVRRGDLVAIVGTPPKT